MRPLEERVKEARDAHWADGWPATWCCPKAGCDVIIGAEPAISPPECVAHEATLVRVSP